MRQVTSHSHQGFWAAVGMQQRRRLLDADGPLLFDAGDMREEDENDPPSASIAMVPGVKANLVAFAFSAPDDSAAPATAAVNAAPLGTRAPAPVPGAAGDDSAGGYGDRSSRPNSTASRSSAAAGPASEDAGVLDQSFAGGGSPFPSSTVAPLAAGAPASANSGVPPQLVASPASAPAADAIVDFEDAPADAPGEAGSAGAYGSDADADTAVPVPAPAAAPMPAAGAAAVPAPMAAAVADDGAVLDQSFSGPLPPDASSVPQVADRAAGRSSPALAPAKVGIPDFEPSADAPGGYGSPPPAPAPAAGAAADGAVLDQSFAGTMTPPDRDRDVPDDGAMPAPASANSIIPDFEPSAAALGGYGDASAPALARAPAAAAAADGVVLDQSFTGPLSPPSSNLAAADDAVPASAPAGSSIPDFEPLADAPGGYGDSVLDAPAPASVPADSPEADGAVLDQSFSGQAPSIPPPLEPSAPRAATAADAAAPVAADGTPDFEDPVQDYGIYSDGSSATPSAGAAQSAPGAVGSGSGSAAPGSWQSELPPGAHAGTSHVALGAPVRGRVQDEVTYHEDPAIAERVQAYTHALGE